MEFPLWLSRLRAQHCPYLNQWVKDLQLPQAASEVADAAQIQCCCGCGVGHSCSSDSTPGPGTSYAEVTSVKKKKIRDEFHDQMDSLGWCQVKCHASLSPHHTSVQSAVAFHFTESKECRRLFVTSLSKSEHQTLDQAQGCAGNNDQQYQRKVLICNICLFSWYTYSHNSWSQLHRRRDWTRV